MLGTVHRKKDLIENLNICYFLRILFGMVPSFPFYAPLHWVGSSINKPCFCMSVLVVWMLPRLCTVLPVLSRIYFVPVLYFQFDCPAWQILPLPQPQRCSAQSAQCQTFPLFHPLLSWLLCPCLHWVYYFVCTWLSQLLQRFTCIRLVSQMLSKWLIQFSSWFKIIIRTKHLSQDKTLQSDKTLKVLHTARQDYEEGLCNRWRQIRSSHGPMVELRY